MLQVWLWLHHKQVEQEQVEKTSHSYICCVVKLIDSEWQPGWADYVKLLDCPEQTWGGVNEP